ncbi:MAG: glucohydrolase, partial [Clostridia bacterium]|nr:glucohydrolase [Deltaproteobacteria bacterium]
NPEVRKAMYDVTRFWLDKGVAGFRLDAIDTLFEAKDLRNAKEGPGKNAYGDPVADFTLQSKQPLVHEVLRELRAVADSYKDDRLLIGEIYTKDVTELQPWYGKKNDELQLPMDTHLVAIKKFTVPEFRTRLVDAQTKLNGHIPLLVTDNHDQPRSWDRLGNGKNDEAIAKINAMALLGTRSTALVYYGQELGMVTSVPTSKEVVKDPIGIIGWPEEKGRDGERTPMQWNGNKNAGFTTGTPWLPVPASAKTTNIADATSRPDSLLSWYRGLLGLRKTNASFQGSTKFLDLDHDGVLGFVRNAESFNGNPVVLFANFGTTPVTVSVKADLKALKVSGTGLVRLLATDEATATKATLEGIELPPFGVYIGEVKK